MRLDKTQISLLIKQDRKAQYELYKDCFGYMMSISLRYQNDKLAAEDVVNRAYLKVLNSIDKYQITKPLKPWVARITVNENIDACRKSQRLRGIIEYNSDQVSDDSNLSNFEFNKAEEQLDADQIHAMVKELPSTTGIVFNMYVLDGYKHHEIADSLGLTTGTSKWHLNSARKRLKVKIEQMTQTEKIIHYGE